MAIVKTQDTLDLAEELAYKLALQFDDVAGSIGIDQLLGLSYALQQGVEPDEVSDGKILWHHDFDDGDENQDYSHSYAGEVALTGKSLATAGAAQVTAGRFAEQEAGRYRYDGEESVWQGQDSGSAKIAPFNPYQDSVVRLLSGSNKWSWQYDGFEGHQSRDQGSFSLAGDLQLQSQIDEYGQIGVVVQPGSVLYKLNESIQYAMLGEYDEETGAYDADYRESGKESFSLSSKQGFGFDADGYYRGLIDSLSYSDKGSAVFDGETFKVDESYKSSGALDLSDADSFDTIIQVLFAGDDKISASSSQDATLWGGAGNDSLTGSHGDDWLVGEAGADKLKGGKGMDWFSYYDAGDSRLDSPDTILDFKSGEDILELDFLASDTQVQMLGKLSGYQQVLSQANAAFAEGFAVAFATDGKKGYVLVDSDADHQADLRIDLTGIKDAAAIAADDFVFAV